MPPEFDALQVSPLALEQGGTEVLRAAVVESGELQVSMRRAFDDPDLWGMLLADIARHAARIFAAETDMGEDAALDRIRAMFDDELSMPTDLGTTTSIS